ncbi:MAG TPA: LuxR C-terminal-related transcriptional regulator [Streptosporangiaceae bacterium]|nr:LuxR C-terminal-related transcriptional regulator [Streptosporangiaceae bacterium]
MLIGRLAERARLDQLLDAVRGRHSAVLVMCGAPGVGKTALLSYAVESAAGLRVASVAGVEPEMELTFAALQQLLSPMLDISDQLPDPQRDALDVALGLKKGPTPDRFLVGLAALSLLSGAAAKQPMLCVVDDAQWLDRASARTLGFVARRLLAEPIALLFATTEAPRDELAGLPGLDVGGLSISDARALLESVVRGPVDDRVLDRVVAETHGNPLALLELPQGLSPAEFTGGFGHGCERELPGRIVHSFQQRFDALPAATQQLLLVASAEPTGDPTLLWRAADLLGIGPQAQAAAQEAGLMMIGDRVVFRHPLVRSAVYQAASPEAQRTVNGALADATDAVIDPERRAWHRAQATLGPDDGIAAELDRLAGCARARGGWSAAAAFLQRSAELTLHTGKRAERTLAAAYAKYEAGALEVAEGLLTAAQAWPLDGLQRARLDLLHARIAFTSSRGSDAPALFLKAARDFEPLDLRIARETYLEALTAALYAGRLATAGDVREVAEAARALPPASEPASATELMLDGMALLVTEGCAAAVPVLKQSVAAFRSGDISDEETLRWWQATHAGVLVWDYESVDVLSARRVKIAREVGALAEVPIGLSARAHVHIFKGEFSEACSLAAEAQSVREATSAITTPYATVALAAFQGRETEIAALVEAGRKDAERRGEGKALTFFQWATALVQNSLGHYDDALAAAQQASDESLIQFYVSWSLVELVEAAARSGKPECAANALRRLSLLTSACGTDWALGVEARSRALVSRGPAAERLYREAIERLARTPLKLELARARLLYGEWLRRERRRRDARDQLRTAYECLDSIGAEAFAERARGELRATGEHARKRTFEAIESLTTQEALVARLAGSGASNRQIAEQLFISPATVAYHLRKVFAKLGVSSRRELARAVPPQRSPLPSVPPPVQASR